MARNPKIKFFVKSDKELNKLHECSKCKSLIAYKDLYFYVDEANISITNNSKGICQNCKKNNN